MKPYYAKKNITVYHGDLRDILPSLDLVDCVCTDPPYALNFMGKNWDKELPSPEYWNIIRESCKQGAMLLSFGGTRTFHRMTCAIEDAGWEIRDCLSWLYSSGMPKGLNISKGIDKKLGAKRKVVREYSAASQKGSKNWNSDRRGGKGSGYKQLAQITEPATNLAAQWEGWNTTLKPAREPIIMAMKALDGNFVNNAIEHGVAGINIDACRIGSEERYNPSAGNKSGTTAYNMGVKGMPQDAEGNIVNGRWPANVLLDEESSQLLDQQTGTLTSGTNCIRTKSGNGYHGNLGKAGDRQVCYGDSGGASRFFYCSKASKSEKGSFNDHPTVKPINLMKYLLTLLSTPQGGVVLDPFAGSGATAVAAQALGRACICVELEEHNCEIIARRLDELQPECETYGP